MWIIKNQQKLANRTKKIAIKSNAKKNISSAKCVNLLTTICRIWKKKFIWKLVGTLRRSVTLVVAILCRTGLFYDARIPANFIQYNGQRNTAMYHQLIVCIRCTSCYFHSNKFLYFFYLEQVFFLFFCVVLLKRVIVH